MMRRLTLSQPARQCTRNTRRSGSPASCERNTRCTQSTCRSTGSAVISWSVLSRWNVSTAPAADVFPPLRWVRRRCRAAMIRWRCTGTAAACASSTSRCRACTAQHPQARVDGALPLPLTQREPKSGGHVGGGVRTHRLATDGWTLIQESVAPHAMQFQRTCVEKLAHLPVLMLLVPPLMPTLVVAVPGSPG